MPETEQKYPKGYTGQCNPEVWDERAKPPQPTEKKVGQITEEQVDTYFRDGVVLIEDYFVQDELEPIKKEIDTVVDYLAERLYADGRIKSKYEEYGLFQRLTMMDKEYPGANILIHKLGIIPKTIRKLWSGEKLCNAVEQLIGPDMGGHPIWNVRPKIPRCEAVTVPWHQDCAYLDTTSYNNHQPTAWIPLLDATPTNGCMEFAVGGHRKGKIGLHQCCSDETWYVMLELEEMKRNLDIDVENNLKVFPVKYGSMLLFNNCIPHRSLNNLSGPPGDIRWSLDLRWQDYRRSWGFHGVTEGMKFRTSSDPQWRPQEADWDEFINKMTNYRNTLSNEDGAPEKQVKETMDTSNTTIVGPWLKSWDITNHTRHTAAMED